LVDVPPSSIKQSQDGILVWGHATTGNTITTFGAAPKPGVNFINVIHTIFLYECCFGSFISSYVYVKKAVEMLFIRKICTYNVDEIDGSWDYCGQTIGIYSKSYLFYSSFHLQNDSSR